KRVKKSFTPKPVAHRPYRPPVRPVRTNMHGARPNRTSFNKHAHSYANRPFHRTLAGRSHYRAPWVPTVNRNFPLVNKFFSTGSRNFPTANRKFPTASRKFPAGSTKCFTADMGMKGKAVKPPACYWDSSCSRHMIGNISYLSDYEPFDGGYVSFGQGGCKITGKGTIKIGKLEFENVYFVKDLKYNLFSMSEICDNKNSVLFTDSECIVLGRDFKLLDNANILLRTPRQHNMYSIDLNNIVLHRDHTCLVAKASANECMLCHRRLGHLNFKTMNKLVRHNLVRGLPTKCFENDHTCTAFLKGNQHKASCKSKLINSVTKPVHTLHMDLFSPTSVSSISHKWYCLVVTDDFYRFTWAFFLKSEDETSGTLKKFITEIENLKDLKVKISRDEGYFIGYSMSSKAFRVFNKRTRRVEENLHVEFLENKAIEKGASSNWLFDIDSLTKSMDYMPVDAGTISTNISGTKDATSQEVKKNVSSLRYIALPNWAHDALLGSSSSKLQDHCSIEVPEGSGNLNLTASTSNPPADLMETLTVESPIPTISSPVLTAYSTDSQEPSSDARLISKRVANQEEIPSMDNILSLTNRFEDILRVTSNLEESNGVEADISNIETAVIASPIPTLRIHKDHPKSQIISPLDTLIQTRNKSKEVKEQSFIATIHQKTDPALLQFCLFSCFLSQVEPKKIYDTLQDPSWVEAM
nr:putative ribonuclease H-like domain-containing protein [Tanacetum cinerariifolium]